MYAALTSTYLIRFDVVAINLVAQHSKSKAFNWGI